MNPNITMWFNSQGLIDSWNTTLENLPDEVSSSIDDVQAYCWGIIWKKNCVYINDKQLYIVLPEEVNHNPDKNEKLLLPVDNFKITIPDEVRKIIKTSSDWKDEYIKYKTVTEYVNKTEKEWQWEQLFNYDHFLETHLKSQESRNATTKEWRNPLFKEALEKSTYTFSGYRINFMLWNMRFKNCGKSSHTPFIATGILWNFPILKYIDIKKYYYGFSIRWVKDSNFIFDKK